MLYFSELNNKTVVTNTQKVIGHLDDMIFSVIGTPYIEKLVISRPSVHSPVSAFKKNQKIIIPFQFFQRLNHTKLIIDDNFTTTEIAENELYVKKNLLDTQVIDIEENNIVRVNDVLIQTVHGHHGFVIYGVDIGFFGALRWFGLEKPLLRIFHGFGKTVPQSSVAWSDIQPLELSRGRVALSVRFDKTKHLHPADLADYLETQNFKNVFTLLESMDRKYLAQVVSELNPNFQISLFKQMPSDKVAFIISIMDPDDAVDVISEFPRKKQDEIIRTLAQKEASQIRRLLTLGSTPLGELLNSEFLTVAPEQTVDDVKRKIKQETGDFSFLDYVYVVNKEQQLIGVLNLHELVLQDANTQIFRFMLQQVLVANLHTPLEVAFRRIIKYKLSSLPVVDENKKIIGIVSMDDLGEEILKKFKG